jgi:hypothetical protein
VQAVNYGANQGIEWVILTNSVDWRVFRIVFGQPVVHEEVVSFSIADVSAHNNEDMERLFILDREGIASDAITSFHQRALVLNRFTIAQVIVSEPVVNAIRRELKRLFPDLKIDQEQVSQLLEAEVLKRELLDGDKAKEATTRIKKAIQKLNRRAAKSSAQIEQISATEAD